VHGAETRFARAHTDYKLKFTLPGPAAHGAGPGPRR